MIKKYEQLKKSSKTVYVNLFDKIIKSGKSISQVKRMNRKQFNKTFDKHVRKNSALNAQKRVIIQQITRHINEITTDYIEKEDIKNDDYKTFLYNQGYKLFRVKKEQIGKVNELKFRKIKKKGQYGVVKIIDLKDEHEYFIKYDTEKRLKSRLEKLKQQYSIKNYITKLLGVYMYKTHITEEFKKGLNQLGL